MLARPYAPKAYGRIAKAKGPRATLDKAAFELHKLPEKKHNAQGPTWAAVERSPEVGARRREARRTLDVVHNKYGDKLEVDYTNGDIFMSGVQVARWDRKRERLLRL